MDQSSDERDLATLGAGDRPFADLVSDVASVNPTPGAGPSLAWTCALAAALVEMVNGVALRNQPEHADTIRTERDRATALRKLALSLADTDAAAYRRVLAAQRDHEAPDRAAGSGGRWWRRPIRSWRSPRRPARSRSWPATLPPGRAAACAERP